VCVHGPPWLWRWALGVPAGLTVVAAAAAVVVLSPSNGAVVGVFGGLVFILPVLSAITVRQYRDQAAAERVRAEQTARLAELDRRQAVVAERTSMARELHDVIANHLSAVAIHSTALLSIRDLDPAAAEKAVRVIRDNSVQGLAEMRQMVELLRDADGADPGQDAPAPGGRLAEVDRLVAQARAAGLAAGLTVTGEPRPLPISVDLAAYRIVQESLTNALKHGDGKVEVTVGYAPDRVTVTVDNPVRLAGHRPLVPGAGAGLIGMRERADLVGGRLTAGPGGTGWCVHAELPAGAL
jgi:signal transduction histidine kinase